MKDAFNKLLNTLVGTNLINSQALANKSKPVPDNLGTTENPYPGRFDRDAVHDFYNIEEYVLQYHNTGTEEGENLVAPKMTAKMSADTMMALKRSDFLRHCSPQQALAWEASRRHRHGSPGGPIQNRVQHEVNSTNATKA